MFYKCAWEKSLNLFGKCSRESRASMSSTMKRQRDGKVKRGFVSWIRPERHCHHQLSLLQTLSFQYLTGFLKVNRGLTQSDWDTCSSPTTGNKFACQACASQIKHALFGMIYECNVVLGALGCEELRVWRWWGGSRWGGGLVSVRFVLQEDWSVAALRVPTATHTSVINHTQPRSTECFVFSSFHTGAASCHHPEKRLLQSNYQEVQGTAGTVLKLRGMYVFQQRNIHSKVATLKQDPLLIVLFIADSQQYEIVMKFNQYTVWFVLHGATIWIHAHKSF